MDSDQNVTYHQNDSNLVKVGKMHAKYDNKIIITEDKDPARMDSFTLTRVSQAKQDE